MKFFTYFIFLFCFSGISQEKSLKTLPLDSLIIKADHFWGKDKFGYYYYSEGSNFIKSKNHERWEFKNPNLGKLKKVDLTNPLRILLFYDVYNKAVILDNQLNETLAVNFSTFSEPILISAIGTASQNRLWLFNANNQQIGFYDLKSNRINYLTVPGKENIKYFDSDLNYFYWLDVGNQLLRCSIFGRVEKLGFIHEIDNFKVVSERRIIFRNHQGFYFYNHDIKETIKIELNKNSILNYSYVEQILTIFTSHQIINFKIESP